MNIQDPFNPDSMRVVKPNPTRLVVLRPLSDPDDGACLHGKVNCIRCDQWCALGSETYDLVVNGVVGPIYQHCASEAAAQLGHFGTFMGTIKDHRQP